MLEIKDLSVSVEDKKIIDNFNLKINDGEIHVIMGPNGVGKSSICKVLFRDDDYKISNGTIKYNNIDLLKLDTSEVAKNGFYLVNQSPLAIEGITTSELLRTVLNEKNEHTDIFSFSKSLEKLCADLDIPSNYVHRDINVGMSGGEKKKIELLHLWMIKPKFIILDEIDSGLDVDAINVVCDSINKYYQEYKPSILIITHHMNIIDHIEPNFVHVMMDGKISKTGDKKLAQEVLKSGFKKFKGQI